MWKSADGCTFYECSNTNGRPSVTVFKKKCPKLNCPIHKRIDKDCCMICVDDDSAGKHDSKSYIGEDDHEFVYKPDKYADIMNPDTYLKHPCFRECKENAAPKICNYTFVVCSST